MLKTIIAAILGDADELAYDLFKKAIDHAEKQGGWYSLSNDAKLATATGFVLARVPDSLLERVGSENLSTRVRRILSLTVQSANGLADSTETQWDDILVLLLGIETE